MMASSFPVRSGRDGPHVSQAAMIPIPMKSSNLPERYASAVVLETRMPKDFRLTSETPKYDGLQEPSAWLEDYLMAVTCQRGSTSTTMQYIQLMLTGSARAWLKSLPRGAYTCWEDFGDDFIRNFVGTCKRPASFEELRAS